MAHFVLTQEFRSPSIEVFWRIYFDPAYDEALDERARIRERALLDSREEDGVLVRAVRLTPERQLPGFVRKLTKAELSYVEHSRFYRADNRIEYEIVPSLLSDRIKMTATYHIKETAPQRILRTYEGDLSVSIPLVGKRIERSTIEEMETSFATSAQVTQEFLDREM